MTLGQRLKAQQLARKTNQELAVLTQHKAALAEAAEQILTGLTKYFLMVESAISNDIEPKRLIVNLEDNQRYLVFPKGNDVLSCNKTAYVLMAETVCQLQPLGNTGGAWTNIFYTTSPFADNPALIALYQEAATTLKLEVKQLLDRYAKEDLYLMDETDDSASHHMEFSISGDTGDTHSLYSFYGENN